jgi:hypothetical protein
MLVISREMSAPRFTTPKKRPLVPVTQSMLPEGMGSTSPGTPYSPAVSVPLSPVVANALAHAAEHPRGALVTPAPKGLGALGEVGRLPGEPPALNVQAANPGTPFLKRVNQADAEDAAAEAAAAAPKKTGGRYGKKSHKKHGKKSHKKHRKTRRRVRFDRI